MEALKNLKSGETFENELGKFIVLEQLGATTLVVMKDLYAKNKSFDNNSSNYLKSELITYFEEEITPKFEQVFGEALKEHVIKIETVDKQYVGDLKCKVRPMTFDEARRYNEYIVNKDLPDYWWLINPWSTKDRGWDYSVAVVSPSGRILNNICFNCYGIGVRPFCILSSNLLVSREIPQFKVHAKDRGDKFEAAGTQWTILSKREDGYLCLADITENNRMFDANSNKWQNSSIREYLNTEFYEKVKEEVGEDNIIPLVTDLTSLDGQKEYGTSEDKVSLLTIDEYRNNRDIIPNTDEWWWLVTPWSTPCNGYEQLITVVSPSGLINNNRCYGFSGVRPVCVLSANMFDEEGK